MKVGGLMMTNKEKILEIAKKNNGIVLTKQVTEAKIPRAVLINMVNEEILFPYSAWDLRDG
jgi:hypothetical protein